MRRIRNPVYGYAVTWVRIPPSPPVLTPFSMAFTTLSTGLTTLVGSLRGHRRQNNHNEVWRELASGFLVPHWSSARWQGAHSQTLLSGKESALEFERIYANADVPLRANSGLGSVLGFAKSVSDDYLFGRDLLWSSMFQAMTDRRILDATLAMRDEISPNHLRQLIRGSLNLLARRQASDAKNFLWELEMHGSLRQRGFTARLDEPDIVAAVDGYTVGVACKKTYPKKGVERTLSRAVLQLGNRFDIGTVAFNFDELVADDAILQTRNRRETYNVLNGMCPASDLYVDCQKC